MKSLLLTVLSIWSLTSFAQMSESEVSDMCMNQIVAGMAQDKILGSESGICVKFNKDSDGNINGMDFKMNTSAFELGKDEIQDAEQKKRIQTIKDFVVNYQKLVTKNNKLNINDVDINVRSYADGVAGPATYDNEIKQMNKWSDLLHYIGDDKAGVKSIMKTAPNSKNLSSAVNFGSLPSEAQSTIRNIVLAKRRSLTICKEFGINNCDKRDNAGFSSPDLEKRAKDKRNCDDRRVSVISVNLNKAVSIQEAQNGVFHPSFGIPSGDKGEELKKDMQMAAIFDLIKEHNKVLSKYKDPAFKKSELDKFQQLMLKSTDPAEKLQARRMFNAISAANETTFSFLDLPEAAKKSPQYKSYIGMVQSFGPRYSNFIRDIKRKFPELYSLVKSGDFYSFKEKSKQITGKAQKASLEQLERNFLHNNGNKDTDVYNFYSTSEALKFHFANNPNSSNLVNAATVMNQSNGNLQVALNKNDLKSAKNKLHDDGRAHWMCYGGCESGIHEDENGEFQTKFRTETFGSRPSSQVEKEFSSVPLGFGSLKTLSVYVIEGCSDCDCLKQKDSNLDEILKKSKKVSINKLSKDAKGDKGFSQTVGNINNPAETCIFTPPVAHTCKVDPSGESEGDSGHKRQPNYSCAMWDKSNHGLKWTSNFIKEGLGLAENSTVDVCSSKAKSLKDVAKEAICDFTDPNPVPDSCQ